MSHYLYACAVFYYVLGFGHLGYLPVLDTVNKEAMDITVRSDFPLVLDYHLSIESQEWNYWVKG